MLLLTDPFLARHEPGPTHPERPARVEHLLASLAAAPVAGWRTESPRRAEDADLVRFHTRAHVDGILAQAGRRVSLDPDTHLSPDSVDAALLAAGAALDAVDAVCSGGDPRAFALVRPPDHHAEPDRAMGFCVFNNLAVAAEHALAQHDVERILVVDWDVHHGNGTAHGFEERADVMVFNLHQSPLYPGTGAAIDHGVGAGEGLTVNRPLPAGSGDAEVLAALQHHLLPAADAFEPDLVLVHAGYDAHHRDPIGGLRVTRDGYHRMAALVRRLAERHAGGRLVGCLEGGYDLVGLEEGVRATLEAWSEA